MSKPKMTLEEHNKLRDMTLNDLGLAVGMTIEVRHESFEVTSFHDNTKTSHEEYDIFKIISDDGKHEMRSIVINLIERQRRYTEPKKYALGEMVSEVEEMWFNTPISNREIKILSK